MNDSSLAKEKEKINTSPNKIIQDEKNNNDTKKFTVFKSLSGLTLQHVQHTFLELYIANNGHLLTAYAELKQLYPQLFMQ